MSFARPTNTNGHDAVTSSSKALNDFLFAHSARSDGFATHSSSRERGALVWWQWLATGEDRVENAHVARVNNALQGTEQTRLGCRDIPRGLAYHQLRATSSLAGCLQARPEMAAFSRIHRASCEPPVLKRQVEFASL